MHPRAFRERFERDMLWIFDETVAERGGTRLVVDATVSLLRQSIFRVRQHRTETPKPAEGDSLRAHAARSGWKRGLTPEIHLLIQMLPLSWLLVLRSDFNFGVSAGILLLECGWFFLYRRRLRDGPPLMAPLSLAHLPLRAQLEDSRKSITALGLWPVPPRPLRFSRSRFVLLHVLEFAIFAGWNRITQQLGHPGLTFPIPLVVGLSAHFYLCLILSGHAADRLESAIQLCQEPSFTTTEKTRN
jgi:hypothetical protein